MREAQGRDLKVRCATEISRLGYAPLLRYEVATALLSLTLLVIWLRIYLLIYSFISGRGHLKAISRPNAASLRSDGYL
jgi:hypothetical protein